MLDPMKSTLSASLLECFAGPTVFARGRAYVPNVVALEVRGGIAEALVRGGSVYVVRLNLTRPDLGPSCSCPHFVGGTFCKHLVAVGLAILAEAATSQPRAASQVADAKRAAALDEALRMYLARSTRGELIDALLGLAVHSEESHKLLDLRALAAYGSDALIEETLREQLTAALQAPREIDFCASFQLADRVRPVLEVIEELLDRGRAGAVASQTKRAAGRLLRLAHRADDPAGVLQELAQRALDAYVRACRQALPDH